MSGNTSALTREEGLFAICLLAAFADGSASDGGRAELKRIGESLLPPELHPAALYQKVLLRQIDVVTASAALDSPEWKQLAYEMAICVCEADHESDDAEKTVLRDLAAVLGLAAPAAAAWVKEADAVASTEPGAIEPFLLPSIPPALPATTAAPRAALQIEVDSVVLGYSILNGALELLPEALATMAILPLQMKLVHRYYANGRSWGGTDAKGTFATLKDNAPQLHARYLPQIREQAGSLDVKRVLAMVRGQ